MTPRVRSVLAALAGLAGGAYFAHALPDSAKKAALIPPAALLVAAVVAQIPRLGAQLLARGLWWSNLVLGVLLTVMGTASEAHLGLPLLSLCGLALVMADHRMLTAAAESEGFRPAAYTGTLQLLLVLALADSQTLLLFAAIEAERSHASAAIFALVAAGLLAGFVGLLRLALWGVGLTMVSSLALAVALVTRAVEFDRDLRAPLLVVAALQLVAPLPMLASMTLKRRLPEMPTRMRALGARAVVVLVVVATVAAYLLHLRLR